MDKRYLTALARRIKSGIKPFDTEMPQIIQDIDLSIPKGVINEEPQSNLRSEVKPKRKRGRPSKPNG